MIKHSLKSKIILPSVIILFFLFVLLTAYSLYEFLYFTGNLARENIAVTAKHLKSYLAECERNSRAAAVSASRFPDVVRAVRERDREAILNAANPLLELYDITYITITDNNGIALARTYEPARFGDSALFIQNVRDAIDGKISTYYESGPLIRVAIHSGAPIYDNDGSLIGAISAGVRLDENESLDRLKELFNVDFTVYLGDARIATTLIRDGERIEGNLDDLKIIIPVLEGKREYFGKTIFMGEVYSTFWKPLINSQNEAFAILTVGASDAELYKAINSMALSCTLIGLIGLVLSITVMLYIITKITNPVNKLVRLVSDVTHGNINVNIDKTPVSNDEIGLLINDVYSLIDVIKSMLGDLSQLTHELGVSGDIEFQIDTDKYSGSYKEIIDGIKELGDSISVKTKAMAAMDVIYTMIYVTDFDYNILYLNRSLIDTYGIDRENCFQQKCYKVIRNLDEPCAVCRMKELLNKDDPYPVTNYEYAFDDHLDRWIGGRSAVIRWVDGSRVLCNSTKDETQVKSMEAQLREAVQNAETASIAKSAFLANMSHEIRTPMNSIMGFTELALDGDVPPKTRDYLTKIQINTEWLLQIINDILDISKVESGRMELEQIPFDLHGIFEHCQTVIMPKALEKGIQMHFYAEPSIGKQIMGDSTRLRQILTNLLSNAVKFTNTGTIKLSSSISASTDKNVTVYFEVKDSGIGMTAEQMARIYEPFVQADSSTTRKYGGTGLGLSITKNLIELMGGRLNVESIPGEGSKFSFYLTFDTIDTPVSVSSPEIETDKIKKPEFEGEILICEDNVMNQLVIREALSRVGLKAVIAENGKEGVDMVKSRMEKGEKPFDLIFMDVQMPVMDGLEAASKIVKLQTGSPIVAMTANIMSGEMELYKESGMPDYVSKPFTSQELWRCLLRYLKPVKKDASPKNAPFDADAEFQKMLTQHFLKNNRSNFDEIVRSLEKGDIDTARRLAHSLKSNAAQLGKIGLQAAAADVESRLKDGENLVSEEQLKLLETELLKALNELSIK